MDSTTQNPSESDEKQLYIDRFHSIIRILELFNSDAQKPTFSLPNKVKLPQAAAGSKRSSKTSDHKAFANLLALHGSVVAVTSITKPSDIALVATYTSSGGLPTDSELEGEAVASNGPITGATGKSNGEGAGQSSHGSDSCQHDPLSLLVSRNVSSTDKPNKFLYTLPLPIFCRSFPWNLRPIHGSEPYLQKNQLRGCINNPSGPLHSHNLTLESHGAILIKYIQDLSEHPEAPALEFDHGLRFPCASWYITNVMAPKNFKKVENSQPYMRQFWTTKVKEGGTSYRWFTRLQQDDFVELWNSIKENKATDKLILNADNRPLDRQSLDRLAELMADTTAPQTCLVSLAGFHEVVKFVLVCYEKALGKVKSSKAGSDEQSLIPTADMAGWLLHHLVYSDAMRLFIQNMAARPVDTRIVHNAGIAHDRSSNTAAGSGAVEAPGAECDADVEVEYRETCDEDVADALEFSLPQRRIAQWIRSLVIPYASFSRIMRPTLLRRSAKLTLEFVPHPRPTQSLAAPDDLLQLLYPDPATRAMVELCFDRRFKRRKGDPRWWMFLSQEARSRVNNNEAKPAKSNWVEYLGSVHCEAVLASLPFRNTNTGISAKIRLDIGTSKASCPCCATLLCLLARYGHVGLPASYHNDISECSLPVDLPLHIHKEMVEHFAEYLKEVLDSCTKDPPQTPPDSSPSHSDDGERLRIERFSLSMRDGRKRWTKRL